MVDASPGSETVVRIAETDDRDIRVLHVDDDATYVELVASALERADDRLSVDVATGGREGLDRAREGEYDCVVLDYDLPDVDGLELLDRIRDDDPRIPVILFTGKGSEAVASEAISAGITDYLQKRPGGEQYELLANRITNAVRKYRAERRAERVERRFLELAENTNDVLWMFSHDWSELLFVNSAYEDIWGRSMEDLAADASDFMAGIHPEDREHVRKYMRRLSSGEPVDLEYRVNAEEDFGRWVWVQGSPVFEDGEVTHLVGFVRDITPLKRREQRLDRKNERLESLQQIVSHDLRNPIEAAYGHLELARHDPDGDHLAALDRQLERMQTIVEDTLALARKGDLVDEPELERLSLGEVAELSWSSVATAGAELRVETDATVRADDGRLKQVFENLFRNAVEHGSTDGRTHGLSGDAAAARDGVPAPDVADQGVTVSVGELDEDDGFYVADDGSGIDPGADVFDPGYTTAENGTGLGLAIVRELAAAHGWKVSATASSAGGARFEFRGVETD